MPGPLEGVKVVELGVWIAGPAAGGVLADWGADVVKIEPPEGDPARLFGAMLGDDLPYNPVFELDNRGKRSVVLDLTTDDGPRGRRSSCSTRPTCSSPTSARAGARAASASTTRRCWPATRASSTATSPATAARVPTPTRRRSTSPRSGRAPASPTCSTPPGGNAAVPARRDGRPQHRLDVRRRHLRRAVQPRAHRRGPARVDVAVPPGRLHRRLRPQHRARLGPPPGDRHARDDGQPVDQQLPRPGDGRHFWIVGLEGDRHWPPLARLVGHPEWIDDPRFATAARPGAQRRRADRPARRGVRDEDARRVGAAVRRRAGHVLVARCRTRSRSSTTRRCATPAASSRCPTASATTPMIATPVDFHGTPWTPRGLAPELGEHTAEVLGELGR